MAKTATKFKTKPKSEVNYTRTIIFKYEPTFEERDAVIRRAIYREQDRYINKPFRYIIVEKTQELARIKFFVKKRISSKYDE